MKNPGFELDTENPTIYLNTFMFEDCTVGRLYFQGFQAWTIELPWRKNQKSISCIPPGVYKVKKHLSPSLGKVLYLQDVVARTWIYIHIGNYTSQIEGCILIGEGIADINNDNVPDVVNSSKAFKELYEKVPDEFDIVITRR